MIAANGRFRFAMLFAIIAIIGSMFVTSKLEATMMPGEACHPQDIKAELFNQANKALEEAKSARAELLSPRTFAEAMKFYQDADNDFQKGRNLEDVRQRLRASVAYFKKATETAQIAQKTLANALKAQSAASQAGAAQFSAKSWNEAELKLSEAARRLEAKEVVDAKKRAGEAEALYRQAELDAIKANYLNETWSLLKEAEKLEVKKYAPATLKRAQNLASQAEKELNENRYDTDVAHSLARQAKYEALHAISLSKIIKELRENRDFAEEFLLSTERPLERIASTIDLVASFETGYDKTANEVIKYIKTLQNRANKLEQDLSERDRQVELLNARIDELEQKLGGVQKEKTELARQMEAQAKIRAQFAAVEQLFDPEEATVLRKGNDIIIRLTGLTFPVAKSVIEAQNFPLLTKVQQAINLFPGCDITIEGHTDSHGSDEKNMQLSQERAEAVSMYLQANMGLETARMNAIGYGESRPIANNETKEGREKNRRIEVILHPKF